MPGQVANAGLASALLPVQRIAATLNRLFAGERTEQAAGQAAAAALAVSGGQP
jgi:hypothetical protein